MQTFLDALTITREKMIAALITPDTKTRPLNQAPAVRSSFG
jgi:hypothetical protein